MADSPNRNNGVEIVTEKMTFRGPAWLVVVLLIVVIVYYGAISLGLLEDHFHIKLLLDQGLSDTDIKKAYLDIGSKLEDDIGLKLIKSALAEHHVGTPEQLHELLGDPVMRRELSSIYKELLGREPDVAAYVIYGWRIQKILAEPKEKQDEMLESIRNEIGYSWEYFYKHERRIRHMGDTRLPCPSN